ncbi:MAG: Gfo/Idh/MocA family oxidoreductase [Acidobacteria bacterium]|nr:Gfo/Idh/MocA family oxidoreductase [Acidobacteriota bacterium]
MTRRTFLAASTAAPALAATNGKKVRAGVLGVQHGHLKGKLQAMLDNPKYDVGPFCEPDRATREGFRAEGFKPKWVSMDELLGDPSLDLILFEGEVRDAIPWGTKIIEAGKHLHLEKPPTNKLEPFRKLVELARSRDKKIQLGYMWRFHKGVEAAFEAYKKGWLGEVFMIRATINSDRDQEQRDVEARYPGGSMFELGGHVVDRVVAFLGKPNKVSTWLRHDTSVKDTLKDNTLAVLEYDSALAILVSSAKMGGSDGHRSFEVIGTDGTFFIQPMEPVPTMNVYLREPHGPYKAGWQQIEAQPQPRYIGDMEELASAILENRPLKDSYDHELALQETLLRASGEIR